MGWKVAYACFAIGLVAGCGGEEQADQVAGNIVMPSAETRTSPDSVRIGRADALAVMEERHEHMETLGDEAKRVNNQLKSSSPDVEVIRRSAAQILALAHDLPTWFPEGSGPDVGKTRAKAEVWQTPDDFAAKADDFVRAAEDFNSAARSGDMGQIEASFAALGKTCKACHDLYREPEED